MTDLMNKTCKPCEGGTLPLTEAEIAKLLKDVPEWALSKEAEGDGEGDSKVAVPSISRSFSFKNYFRTMAFVNAVAWIAHQENHHPDMEIGYNWCIVRYTTHAIKGLSENDFICAAKVDGLLFQP